METNIDDFTMMKAVRKSDIYCSELIKNLILATTLDNITKFVEFAMISKSFHPLFFARQRAT